MATLQFTVPDAVLPRVIAVLCAKYDYDSTKQVNETQQQFARRMMIDAMKREIHSADWEVSTKEALSTITTIVDTSGIT